MNQRERLLVILLGAAAVIFGGRGAINWYRGQKVDLSKSHAKLTEDYEELQGELAEIAAKQANWRQFGRQTLSTDENISRRLWRDRLAHLTSEAGLKGTQPNLGNAIKEGKHGLRVLGAKVEGEGTLDQVKGFLFDLYREPYVIRCKSFMLEPIMDKPKGGKGKGKAGGVAAVPKFTGRYEMTVHLETLMLPTDKDSLKFKTVNLDKPTSRPASPERFPMFASVADYAAIKDDLFKRYVPPVPPAKATAKNPNNGKKIVVTDPDNVALKIEWKTGKGSKGDKLFFGPSAAQMKEVAEFDGTSWQVTGHELKIGKKFYWRVDGTGDGGTTRGDTWNFEFVDKAAVVVKGPVKPSVKQEPPAFPEKEIRAVLSSSRVQQVVLTDKTTNKPNPNAPDNRCAIGDRLNKGIIIFVHPIGAVTEESDGTRRFHPVGSIVKDGQVLSQAEHPRIYHELTKLETRLAGTTDSE